MVGEAQINKKCTPPGPVTGDRGAWVSIFSTVSDLTHSRNHSRTVCRHHERCVPPPRATTLSTQQAPHDAQSPWHSLYRTMEEAPEDDAAYDRRIAAAEHARLSAAFEQGGFREGLEEGKVVYLQAGFDAGFARAATAGFARGRLLGALAACSALLAASSERLGDMGKLLGDRAAALAQEVRRRLQPAELTQEEALAATARGAEGRRGEGEDERGGGRDAAPAAVRDENGRGGGAEKGATSREEGHAELAELQARVDALQMETSLILLLTSKSSC